MDDSRLIAGFFREALFHQRRITLLAGNRTYIGYIASVDESSTRERTAERKLRIELQQAVLPAGSLVDLDGMDVHFECSFPSFIAQWSGRLSSLREGTVETLIPPALELKNLREWRRHSIQSKTDFVANIAISSMGLHSEACMQIDDYSSEGVGGTLSLPAEFPLSIESRVRGGVVLPKGRLHLNGFVKYMQVLSRTSGAQGDVHYRIGIQLESPSTPSLLPYGAERRRFPRKKSSIVIEVCSPLNHAHLIRLKISELSVAGFSAELVDPHDIHLLPLGVGVNEVGTSLVFQLLTASASSELRDTTLRFQISSAEAADRLKWLRRLPSGSDVPTSRTTATGADLIELFCQSGAFSSEYLRLNKAGALALQSGLSSGISESSWLHRWIERTHSGDARGHIGAVRIGDSLWHVGDLAGSPFSERKISDDFLPDFLTSFRDYCLVSSPCPRVILTWNDGHPYWKGYDEFLKQEGSRFVSASLKAFYTRMPKVLAAQSLEPDWEITEIQGSDHSLIDEMSQFLQGAGVMPLARAFDFCVESFESPGLRSSIAEGKGSFDRRYLKMTRGDDIRLAVLSRFPVGSSPHRTFDVPWILPLSNSALRPLEGPEQTDFLRDLRSRALGLGFSFPGVLEPISQGTTEAKAAGVSTSKSRKLMNWIIGHPRILDYFSKRSKS